MGSKKTTESKNTPWAPAQPYVTGALANQQDAYKQGAGTLANYSPALTGALDKLSANVTTPPQYLTDARAQLSKTINGDYLDPSTNPYSGGIAKLIADRTMGNYAATYGGSGRAHGGMAALLSGQGVGDALTNFYGNLYQQERGNQQNAIGMAPAFNADEATGANALINGVNAVANQPLSLANAYGQGVTQVSSPYVQNTTTQKTGGLGSTLGTIAGIGLTAAGALTGNPMLMAGGLKSLSGGGGEAGIPSAGGGGLAGLLPGTGYPGSTGLGTIATGSGYTLPGIASSFQLPQVQGLSRYLG